MALTEDEMMKAGRDPNWVERMKERVAQDQRLLAKLGEICPPKCTCSECMPVLSDEIIEAVHNRKPFQVPPHLAARIKEPETVCGKNANDNTGYPGWVGGHMDGATMKNLITHAEDLGITANQLVTKIVKEYYARWTQ